MTRRSILAALVVTASVLGQDVQRIPRQTEPTTGALQGIVRTETGLGVGGARLVFTNAGTHSELVAITVGDGVFRIADVPPGLYDLNVTCTGFQSIRRDGFEVRAGNVVTVELTATATPARPPEEPRIISRAYDGEDGEQSPVRALVKASEMMGMEIRIEEPLAPEEEVFTPVPDRWQYEFPKYRRYAGGQGEVQYMTGHRFDPYNQNRLKGDYPIFGGRTFLNLAFTSDTFVDGRKLPVGSGLGSASPDSADFFGKFGQLAVEENFGVSVTLFRGDTSFRPIDWQIRFTPEFNFNYLAAQENGIVNIDVRKGTTRYDQHAGLQEAFVEAKIKDLSNEYDFVSARAGIQTFNSDFRGFIFFDQEPGLRIFGNFKSNRYQYNLAAFTMLEKDTNSGLNTFNYRNQQVFIANIYRQDFLKPGYTIQASFHYDKDDATLEYDTNNFLVRPQPIGAVKPHAIRAYYYGLTGDGHIGRINVSHAFYQVLGHDTLNPIAGKRMDINGQMAAVELSLDKDWLRYRVSFFFESGEKNPRAKDNTTAHGFDAIFDNPNFAGGIFSFWNREGIRLTSTGVGIVGGDSLDASLRSSKIEGQASFVNPGLFLYNAGVDADVTPKLRAFFNLNLVRFEYTAPLEVLLFQTPIHAGVGADNGIGIKYRPKLSDNISITAGFNTFIPFQGFKDISTGRTLYSLFTNVRFQF